MNSKELAANIKTHGREITFESLNKTWQLYTPLHPIAPFAGVTIQRDIPYGEHARHRLDLFHPVDTDNQNRPALIFVHGGGFVRGDKYTPGTPFYDNIGVWAVKHNVCGITITHRLAPEFQWPAVIEDIAALVIWIKNNAALHGIDSNRLYLMGQSAGAAHVGAYLAHPEIYAPRTAGIAGAILLSGLFNLETLQADEVARAYFGEDTRLYRERSAIHGLQKSTVPVMAALAEYDPPDFERQTLELLTTLQQRDQKLPHFVHMIGQNHLSGILHLGLEGDLLGPQILNFIK